MKKNKRTIWPLALAGVLALALLALGGYFMEQTVSGGPQTSGKTVEEMMNLGEETEEAPVYYDGTWYVRNPHVKAYLLMGVDRSGEALPGNSNYEGGQADVQLLLVVDEQSESYSILQINRDTMTEIEVLGLLGDVVGTRVAQIALAHGYGRGMEDSCENAVRAVSNLLYGMEIQGYAAVQMDAIAILNDMLGGVTVTIEDDFSAVDPTLILGETITLQGEQATRFIRNRFYVGDETNLSRMKRHRAYLSAFAEQFHVRAAESPGLILEMYDAILPYMVTDMGSKTVSQIAEQCHAYQNNGIVTIEGEARMGEEFVEYYLDEDSLMKTVLRLFYHENTDESTEDNHG